MEFSRLTTALIYLGINFTLYLFFILYAFRKHYRYNLMTTALLVIGYVLVSTALILVFLMDKAPMGNYRYPVLIPWVIGTVVIARVVLRAGLPQLVFVVFVVLNTQYNVMLIAQVLRRHNLLTGLVGGEGLRFLLLHSLVVVAFLPLLWYVFIYLFKRVIDRGVDTEYWNFLFLIPIFSYLYCILSSINSPVGADSKLGVDLFIMFLLNMLSFFSYVVALQMLVKIQDNLVAADNAVEMERQLIIQNEQYKTLTDSISQTDRFRHDMRHHFIALKGFLEGDDLGGARAYLDSSIGNELSKEQAPVCERHAVDLILRHYIAQARDGGVRVNAAVRLTNSFRMCDADLCVVFGNLVENAVEACRRQTEGERFITIKAKLVHEEMLVITISNSCNGEILRSGEDLVSQKHEGIGIGTASVRSIVERNGGSCKFSMENTIFTAAVLLAP